MSLICFVCVYAAVASGHFRMLLFNSCFFLSFKKLMYCGDFLTGCDSLWCNDVRGWLHLSDSCSLYIYNIRVKISPFAVTSTKFHLQRIPTWLTSRVHCPTPGIHTIRLRVYGCSSLLAIACRSTAVSLTSPTAVWLSCMIPRSVVPLSTNWLFALADSSYRRV